MDGLLHEVQYARAGNLDHPAVIQTAASVVNPSKTPDRAGVPDLHFRKALMDL